MQKTEFSTKKIAVLVFTVNGLCIFLFGARVCNIDFYILHIIHVVSLAGLRRFRRPWLPAIRAPFAASGRFHQGGGGFRDSFGQGFGSFFRRIPGPLFCCGRPQWPGTVACLLAEIFPDTTRMVIVFASVQACSQGLRPSPPRQ